MLKKRFKTFSEHGKMPICNGCQCFFKHFNVYWDQICKCQFRMLRLHLHTELQPG